MKSSWLSIIRIIIVVISSIPIIYFLLNLHNSEFIINSMGNWFATIVGVFAGGILAYEIANYQKRIQEENKYKQLAQSKIHIALSLSKNVKEEINDNILILERLGNRLFDIISPNITLWDYSVSIIDNISTRTYDRIIFDSMSSLFPFSYSQLLIAYDILITFQKRVKEARFAYCYYMDKDPDSSIINEELSKVKQLIDLTINRLQEAVTPLEKDIDYLTALDNK